MSNSTPLNSNVYTVRQFSGQNLLNCDEKVELADEESEETFEEALEDEPNDQNVRFDDD